MEQLGHHETLEKMPILDIDCVLYVCDISCENLGLILRSADIFGVNAIYYLRGSNMIHNKQLLKLSRNSGVPVYFSEGTGSLLDLKDSGYQIVALEITNTSVPLRFASFPQKTCLVVGNERGGIPADILNIAERSYHIEMVGGRISSLNVSVAASIALYEISQHYLNRKESIAI